MRTLRVGLACLCVCLLTLEASAGEPLELEDFVSVRGISSLSFSPEELFLLWQATRYAGPEGPEERVWLAELESGQIRPLGGEGKSASAPQWRPGSSRAVSFLSDRESKPAQVFVVSVAGGEPRAITHSATAIKGYAWSPDGKRLAYIADVPRPDVNEEKDWRIVDRDDPQAGLWELEVESGKVRLLTQGDWKVRECVWAADGKGVYFIGTRTPANDRHTDEIFLAETDRRDSIDRGSAATDAATTAIRSLHRLSGYATDLKISADGSWVSFIDARNGGDAHDLFLYSVKNGSARNLSAGPIDQAIRGETFEGDGYTWTPDGDLIATYAHGFATGTSRLSTAGVVSRIDVPAGSITALAISSKNGWTAAVASSTTALPEVHVRRGKGGWRQLSQMNARFGGKQIQPLEIFQYPSFDGRTIEAGLLQPAAISKGELPPLILWVHGGPAFHSKNEFHTWGQYFAQRGYAVLYVNFRGSIGYGYEFMTLNRKDWGGGDFKDLMAGVDAVIRMGKADPNRLAIAGWSYGGYMAAWAITQTTRFKASMAGAGLYDLASEFGTEKAPAYDEWYMGTPYDHLDVYMRSSPMSHIKDARTPTLILHGEHDPVDPLGQAQQLYRALKWLGVPTELVVYSKGDHGVQKQRHVLDKYRRTVDWLDQYVKAGSPAPGSAVSSPSGR